jgi:hypothetical protein
MFQGNQRFSLRLSKSKIACTWEEIKDFIEPVSINSFSSSHITYSDFGEEKI